jgi:hypothetical protein
MDLAHVSAKSPSNLSPSPSKAQMNNTGFSPPITIPIQYSSLNQKYQYNSNTNTIPTNFLDLVLFFLAL